MLTMNIKTILVSRLDPAICAEPAEICPKGIVVPNDFTLTDGARKFIVMRCDHTLILAIGPEMAAGSYYYHKQILEAISGQGCDQCRGIQISGGGSVKFTLRGTCWSAEFSGRSGDFGVYDPIILTADFRRNISQDLGILVNFVWDSRA